MLEKYRVFYVGGEDVRMRIPILKKMIEKGYFVGAIGFNDSNAFKDQVITYFDYHLNRYITHFKDLNSS